MPSRLATPACGTGGSRTLILARKRRLLCQSSYGPMCGRGEDRTHRTRERRGYGPLDLHWSPPVLVRHVVEPPTTAAFTTAIRAVRERQRRAGGGNRTRFSGKASRCPTNGRHPRVHGSKESNLQQRVLAARAPTDGASAVEGCACQSTETRGGRGAFATRPREGLLGGERSGSWRHAKAQGERLALVTLEAAIDDLVDAQRRARRRDRRE